MTATHESETHAEDPHRSTGSTGAARSAGAGGGDRRRLVLVVAVAVGLIVLLAGAGIWWFLRDDAPPEVSLDAAVEVVDGDTTTDASSAAASAGTAGTESEGAADGDVAGTWTVNTELGGFDDESATGSFVGFRIEEELRGVGSTTAVGRTGDVAGTIVIEGTTLTEAVIDVDVTGITTDDSRRDDNVWDALEVDQFPTASFVLAEPIELGEGAAEGAPLSVVATGDLTIHGVTRRLDVALGAQLVDGVVAVVGSTDMTFSDYGVEVPDGGPVISVDDAGVVELQLLLTR